MNTPTFSVITVTRNSGEGLRRTAQSFARQQADAEHLIIDGASTDNSLDIAREFAASGGERVRLISEPDKGVFDAMNKGIRLARGRYIYFLGAGDTLFDGALNEIARALPAHNRALVYGDAILEGRRYDGEFDVRKLCDHNICHQAIFYGAEVFPIVGVFDLKYRRLADWEINMRCFADRSVTKIYAPVLVADFEPGGGSTIVDPDFWEDRLMLIRRNFGLLAYMRSRWPQPVHQIYRRFRRMAAVCGI